MTPTNQTHITAEHRDVFNALTSGDFSNFALFSCHVNGEPAAAIVAIQWDEQRETYLVEPLFVSITDSMTLTDHDGAALGHPTPPAWLNEIHSCDTLEIHPVCDLRWNDAEQGQRHFSPSDDNETWCEICNRDQAQFWSVYGHLKTGGITCFEDFATEAEAIAWTEKLYQSYPHLLR